MTETTTVRAEAETTQPSTNGHDSKGRFATGNKGGPGNPFARQVAALRQALLNCVTPEDIKEHARALNEKAKRGDAAATKLLWQYTLGKPAPTPNPDQLDVDEWRNLQQHSRKPTEMSAIFNGFPANMACDLTKINWPAQLELQFGAPFRRGLETMDKRDARKAAKKAKRAQAAPSTNGSNDTPRATGIAPLPNNVISDQDDYLIQQLLRQKPSTNACNGTSGHPSGNGPR